MSFGHEFDKKKLKIRKVPNRNFEFRLGNINKFTYAALCNVDRHFYEKTYQKKQQKNEQSKPLQDSH